MIRRMTRDGRKWADFSECDRYRYTLGRGWDGGLPALTVIGINPSTATHEEDDPTIRRCVRFAQDSGHGALVMLNLFAWRDKDVRALAQAEDPVGPENDLALDMGTLGMTVWASGPPRKVPPRLRARFATVERFLRDRKRRLHALAFTADGYPSHPLFLPATCRPMVWP
jgi:hypothetical protein